MLFETFAILFLKPVARRTPERAERYEQQRSTLVKPWEEHKILTDGNIPEEYQEKFKSSFKTTPRILQENFNLGHGAKTSGFYSASTGNGVPQNSAGGPPQQEGGAIIYLPEMELLKIFQ